MKGCLIGQHSSFGAKIQIQIFLPPNSNFDFTIVFSILQTLCIMLFSPIGQHLNFGAKNI
jgi:hypothetical protein